MNYKSRVTDRVAEFKNGIVEKSAKVFTTEVVDFVVSITNTFFGGTEYYEDCKEELSDSRIILEINKYITDSFMNDKPRRDIIWNKYFDLEYLAINNVLTLRLYIKDDNEQPYTTMLL